MSLIQVLKRSFRQYRNYCLRLFYFMETEKWMCIAGFIGLYEVSNLGRIRSIGRRGKVLSLSLKEGYFVVELYSSGIGRRKRVNRLVAFAFCSNPYCKPEVNHIDCNKLNNMASNLEWVTSEENKDHAVLNGLYRKGVTHSNTILTENQVAQIYSREMPPSYYVKTFGITRGNVNGIISGERWGHYTKTLPKPKEVNYRGWTEFSHKGRKIWNKKANQE